MSFVEILRIAVAGETDPDEVRKRTEEALAEHRAREGQRKLNAAAHVNYVHQWDDPKKQPRHKRVRL